MLSHDGFKYIIYARKSTESEDRQITSIEDQLEVLEEYAKRQNLEIVDTISESKSAKIPYKRDGFDALIDRIRNGEADGIICWKLNRLSRNSIEAGFLMHDIQNNIIKRILTPSKTYHPKSNVVEMALEWGIATQSSIDLSEDVKRGLRKKAKRGWYPTLAPAGYRKHPDMVKGQKEIIIDAERFHLIRKIWDLVLSERYNPTQALAYVTQKYHLKTRATKKFPSKPYGKTAIYDLLKNPFYYGEFEYPKGSGKWYKGKHKPMVTKWEFDKVQKLINPNYKGKNTNKLSELFPYKEPLICAECKSSITAERKRRVTCDCKYRFSALHTDICPKCKTHINEMKTPKIDERIYYHCTKQKNRNCSQKGYSEENLEIIIKDILSQLTLPKEFKDIGIKLVKQIEKEETFLQEQNTQTIKKRLDKIEKDSDRLLELLTDFKIDAKAYNRRIKQLEQEKKEIDLLLLKKDSKEAKKSIAEKIEFSTELIQKFENADKNQKKAIFNSLGSNQFIKDGKLELSKDSALYHLICIARVYKAQKDIVRTSKSPYFTKKKAPLYGLSSDLCPLMKKL